jgi:hypothetical protein
MLLAAVMVLIGLGAAPAAADKPVQLGPFQEVIVDVDPCNGGLMEFTLNLTFFEHQEHNNNFVGRIAVTGSTDSGYILKGHDRLVQNQNGVRRALKVMGRNPETGDMLQVTPKFRMVGNSPVIDSFDLRCVGAPTI